jgi:hypothetical protein
MTELFTVENLMTLLVLTALETVLGFDNLLYISIEAKRVAPARQKYVRQLGMVLAIGLRIVLLFVVLQLIAMFQSPLFGIHLLSWPPSRPQPDRAGRRLPHPPRSRKSSTCWWCTISNTSKAAGRDMRARAPCSGSWR